MWRDVIVICVLFVASSTGVYTMERHLPFFRQFRLMDIWRLRADALIYLLNLASASTCLFKATMRMTEAYETGWGTLHVKWYWSSMFIDVGLGLTATGLHLLTFHLLKKAEFCVWCQRKY